jgi:formylmethanofuran dehydrogenase subunit E
MPVMTSLDELLAASAALHQHLCPRQVLGVRIGLLAGRLLAIDVPRTDKRLLTIVETDGCAADGIAVATGCWVGRRTLRIEDYGKVAATVIDTVTGRAVRVTPLPESRDRAPTYAPAATNRWEAQLYGYQRMPDALLLRWQEVTLTVPLEAIISTAAARAVCGACGEEIINQREVLSADRILCRACQGPAYYRLTHASFPTVTASLPPAVTDAGEDMVLTRQ